MTIVFSDIFSNIPFKFIGSISSFTPMGGGCNVCT